MKTMKKTQFYIILIVQILFFAFGIFWITQRNLEIGYLVVIINGMSIPLTISILTQKP